MTELSALEGKSEDFKAGYRAGWRDRAIIEVIESPMAKARGINIDILRLIERAAEKIEGQDIDDIAAALGYEVEGPLRHRGERYPRLEALRAALKFAGYSPMRRRVLDKHGRMVDRFLYCKTEAA